MSGLYVHVPFCRRRCLYCDFYTIGERLADWPGFVSAVRAEAAHRIPSELPERIDTLYIGGGTPSLIPSGEFLRLASGLTAVAGKPVEFTIEVNPDDVTSDKAAAWKMAGVNRVSMGVQSLVDSELKSIGRRHDSVVARRAYDTLRGFFDNISLDIMFGLPGQSVESLLKSADGIIDMAPEHVSAYSLMYEERTALTRLRDAGRISEIPEEDSAGMFAVLSKRLAGAGYEQYEISNYARAGYRSRHNSAYWKGAPYVGLGPGAHSYDGCRVRLANNPDYKKYVEYWCGRRETGIGVSMPPVETETLSDDELREEMIMTRLRTREGLSLEEYERRFGSDALRNLMQTATPWLRSGELRLTESKDPRLLETPELGIAENKEPNLADNSETGPALSLTSTGVMISDEIILSLF